MEILVFFIIILGIPLIFTIQAFRYLSLCLRIKSIRKAQNNPNKFSLVFKNADRKATIFSTIALSIIAFYLLIIRFLLSGIASM